MFNPENIAKIEDNLLDFDKNLKTCEYQTLIIICKFIKLIKGSEENEEIEKQRNIFIKNICKYSLGYSSEENTLKKDEINNIEKLFKLILFINNEPNDMLNVEDDENKNQILSNVYEQLKDYFESKKKVKNLALPENKNGEDIFTKINDMMNSAKDSTFNVSKDLNNKSKTNKQIRINYNNNKENEKSNVGILNFNSLNGSTFKLSKTMKINLTKSKSLFKESIEVIKEIEDNKDIPWIREEDC